MVVGAIPRWLSTRTFPLICDAIVYSLRYGIRMSRERHHTISQIYKGLHLLQLKGLLGYGMVIMPCAPAAEFPSSDTVRVGQKARCSPHLLLINHYPMSAGSWQGHLQDHPHLGPSSGSDSRNIIPVIVAVVKHQQVNGCSSAGKDMILKVAIKTTGTLLRFIWYVK
ncbi:hypothetical protein Tco_0989678 [Tanacetum coccineum]|uniref:Uncharacterized protein n=1 Tax=Tanacetum coccineum TaxID=301880 RepID=A0ABQ5EUZ5_9ASTR